VMPANVTPRTARAGARLEDLLASRFLLGREAGRIRSAGDLPFPLEQCAGKLAPDLHWRAYGHDNRIFFAIARAHDDRGRHPSSAAIDVYLLDERAAAYSGGVWDHDIKHGWWLDSVLEPSYACEHGWWLDALLDPPVLRRAARSRSPRT
jgi:hypothetical protein